MNEKTDATTQDSLFDGLKDQLSDYTSTLGRKAVSAAGDQVDKLADRLDGGGGPAETAAKEGAQKLAQGENPAKAAASAAGAGAKDKAKDVIPGMGGSSSASSGSGDFKFNNIVEWTDIGVPVSVAYNTFTQFEDWPSFMKKVENVHQIDDVTLRISGQVFLSHRTWEATITQQVPDSHIVWESSAEKGRISGSVSFHEVSPTLTRMLAVAEYYPNGFMERIANAWKAVARRFKLELKLYVHHVMTQTILDPEGVEGWRGEIREGEVVTPHEDALAQEADESEDESPAAEDSAQPAPAEESLADDEVPEDEELPEDADPEEAPPEEEAPLEEEPAEDEPLEEEVADDEPLEDEEAEPDDPDLEDDEAEYEDTEYDEDLDPEDAVTPR